MTPVTALEPVVSVVDDGHYEVVLGKRVELPATGYYRLYRK
jgi:hypothetical protein